MGKKKNWVDYKEIKAHITIKMVLDRYGLFENLKQSGKNYAGCCPIHQGTQPRQFTVNLDKNIFNCFGDCKSGGNVLDFVAKMEKVSIHDAGLLLKNWFLTENPGEKPKKQKEKSQPADTYNKSIELVREEKKFQKKDVNPPLKFQLKDLDPDHPFFKKRGIQPKTVEYFGLGHCSKGIMKGRIAIPIHNKDGELVAYCGRAVDKTQIEEKGKYKLPGNFHKSEIVYNLHRQKNGKNGLILVESYISVWKLYQAGFPTTAALMGSSLSKPQKNLIFDVLGPSGKAILLFDGDEDGKKCTIKCLNKLSPMLFVKAVDISGYGRKPHQLTYKQIKNLM